MEMGGFADTVMHCKGVFHIASPVLMAKSDPQAPQNYSVNVSTRVYIIYITSEIITMISLFPVCSSLHILFAELLICFTHQQENIIFYLVTDINY